MDRPNFLLISVDTLRADHLGCYGYGRETSPNIDALAVGGMLCENAYTTGAWTPPGHGSIFTGLYPRQHGAIGKRRLRQGVRTLAEGLSGRGFATCGIVNNSQVGALVGFERGHKSFLELWKGRPARNLLQRGARYARRRVKELLHLYDKGAAQTVDEAIRWVDAQRRAEKPFYLFLHFIEPHNPLSPPRPFRQRFLGDPYRRGKDRRVAKLLAENPLYAYTEEFDISRNDRRVLADLYDGEIACVDHQIGRLMKYLETKSLAENTVVILTADHGEHLGEKGLYSHVGSLYEPIARVPLIFRFPKTMEPGTRYKGLAQTTDIYNTVRAAAGGWAGDLPNHETSVDLAKAMKGSGERQHVMGEWEGRVPFFVQNRLSETGKDVDPSFFTRELLMVRDERYKAIWASDGTQELYELAKDPDERTNIAASGKAILEGLRKIADRYEEGLQQDDPHDEEIALDRTVEENLRKLGYL